MARAKLSYTSRDKRGLSACLSPVAKAVTIISYAVLAPSRNAAGENWRSALPIFSRPLATAEPLGANPSHTGTAGAAEPVGAVAPESGSRRPDRSVTGPSASFFSSLSRVAKGSSGGRSLPVLRPSTELSRQKMTTAIASTKIFSGSKMWFITLRSVRRPPYSRLAPRLRHRDGESHDPSPYMDHQQEVQ